MVSFAFLGNTLFLTILVSMLSNTFASIVKNATAEIAFRRTVLTFEGVKSDAIFGTSLLSLTVLNANIDTLQLTTHHSTFLLWSSSYLSSSSSPPDGSTKSMWLSSEPSTPQSF